MSTLTTSTTHTQDQPTHSPDDVVEVIARRKVQGATGTSSDCYEWHAKFKNGETQWLPKGFFVGSAQQHHTNYESMHTQHRNTRRKRKPTD